MVYFGKDMQDLVLQARRVSRPSVKKFPLRTTPLAVLMGLHRSFERVFLLESASGPGRMAEFSFVGFDPLFEVRVDGGDLHILSPDGEVREDLSGRDPLEVLKSVVGHSVRSGSSLRFTGGAVGHLSYDCVRYWEKVRARPKAKSRFPDMEFGIYDDGLVFDHREGATYYFHRGRDRSGEVLERARRTDEPGELDWSDARQAVSKEAFEESVRKAKEYIVSGDIFQVVLSKRYDLKVTGDLIRFYSALRRINPSPYMYYLKMGERAVVGSSPEMLVRAQDGQVESFPIAGTRPRTDNTEENREARKDLLSDPKELAEHVMLVDLARNDLGRVSEFGSIKVPSFMKLKSFSHVYHIVSRVVGRLARGRSCYDALRATFPAGTVSGAPKVRAMEIIEESEAFRRGPYAGVVGYFSYEGNCDFAITIRTLVADGEHAQIQTGAGIVADSVPEREWLETEHKGRALIRALEEARGVKR